MTDDDLTTSRPHLTPSLHEHLFEFVRELDRARFRCELRDHGDYGIEAQWFKDGEPVVAHRFETHARAVQWAEAERAEIEKGWR